MLLGSFRNEYRKISKLTNVKIPNKLNNIIFQSPPIILQYTTIVSYSSLYFIKINAKPKMFRDGTHLCNKNPNHD